MFTRQVEYASSVPDHTAAALALSAAALSAAALMVAQGRWKPGYVVRSSGSTEEPMEPLQNWAAATMDEQQVPRLVVEFEPRRAWAPAEPPPRAAEDEQRLAQANAELVRSRAENAALQRDLVAHSTWARAAQSSIADLQAKLRSAEERAVAAEARASQAQKEGHQIHVTAVATQAELAQTRSRLAETEDYARHHHASCTEALKARDELAARHAACEQRLAEVEDYARRHHAACAEAMRTRDELATRFDAAAGSSEAERYRLWQELEECRARLGEASASEHAEIERLRAEVGRQYELLVTLHKEQVSSTQSSDALIADLRHEISQLHARLREAEAERGGGSEEAARLGARLAEAEARVRSLTEERDALRAKVAELDGCAGERDALRAKVAELDGCAGEGEGLRAKVAELEGRVTELRSTVASLEEERRGLRATVKRLEDESASACRARDEHQAEAGRCRGRLEALETETKVRSGLSRSGAGSVGRLNRRVMSDPAMGYARARSRSFLLRHSTA